MPTVPIVAKGVERRVMFDGATITIHGDAFARFRDRMRRRDTGDRVIPIEDVVAVDFASSTVVLNGHIRFTLVDDEDRRPPPNAAAAAKWAMRDPNAVMFSRYHAAEFAALRDAVATAIADRAAE